MKQWLKALGLAALKGGIPAAATVATAFSSDGFNRGELKVMAAVFMAGALSGVAMLFQAPPRDPGSSERRTD